MSRQPLIVGNWKMNGTVGETLKRITALDRTLDLRSSGAEIVIAPPFTALYSASVTLQELPIKLAAQNLFYETEGPYTGEVSGPFLKEVGCDYVLVGHSERRMIFGENDEWINRKLRAALAAELAAILCIGETEAERESGQTFARLEEQLRIGLLELHVHDIEELCIAYEPVWAIGTGKNAQPAQVGEVHDWIRNDLTKRFDAPTANAIRLLYGGSVTPDNAEALSQIQHVDGLLVGGASLDADKFSEIIQKAARQEP